ncbi:MAG: rhodanese-like domain-containing protein [Pseudomonadota bacterium]
MRKLLTFLIFLLPSAIFAEVVNIDIHQLKSMLKEDVVVIDVRTPGEWKSTGIVEGSIPIMFFDEKRKPLTKEWMQQASEHISPNKKLILICRTGNRSGAVGNYLVKQHGYQNVYNVKGGIVTWKKAGYTTVSP